MTTSIKNNLALQYKVALITGSTSGIGLAIAHTLAKNGCNIVLNGFGDADEIEKIRQKISADYNVDVIYINADLMTGQGAIDLVNQAVAKFGKVDILVNNAGIQYVSPVDEFLDQKWEDIIALNLSAAFYTIKYALPIMRGEKWGRIINIASAHGKVASANKSAYVAAKHGVIGLTKVIALETAQENITCNAICPGWVLTPLVEQQIADWAERDNITIEEAGKLLLSEKQPSLQFVNPQDIGDMVLYLCSQSANQITGADFSIDGGWTAK